jgi:hypothetical protein
MSRFTQNATRNDPDRSGAVWRCERATSLVFHEGDHPLVVEQRECVPIERVRAIAESQMHS